MTDIHNIDQILSEWAENVIIQIQDNLDSTGTTASGKTKKSLEYELTDTGIRILGRQYFQGVEEGRPGGGIPFRFQDIIRKWMDDKGIANQFGNTESEKRSAAWLISQFIKDNGTRLYRKGGRDDIYTTVLDEEVPKLEEQLEIKITETIVNNLK